MRNVLLILLALSVFSCKRREKTTEVGETRTSGVTTILVDETFSHILGNQIQVFKSDYPDATVNTVSGSETAMINQLLEGKHNLIILSRMLNENELKVFQRKQFPVFTDRFAIDGIALITGAGSIDTLISSADVFDIMQGKSDKKLVFDHAGSATLRYFMNSANVSRIPESGVYTLNSNNDVIRYIAKNQGYIGVVGLNWLINPDEDMKSYVSKVKVMAVKGLEGTKGADKYYKPTQNNLINAYYPFLRNIYIINCEGKNGLGTGFANWLCSPRGQLIVLKSGLGPHKLVSRGFNINNNKKKKN